MGWRIQGWMVKLFEKFFLLIANESTILTMVGGTKNSRMNGKVVWKILFVANESTILTKNYLWQMKKKKKKL